MLEGVAGRGAPSAHTELAEDRAEMRVDGSRAQAKLLGDLLIRETPDNEAKHLDLARGEPVASRAQTIASHVEL